MSVPAALRSLLFVPGDSERKQAKALACAADGLILDLEDSVSAEHLPAARQRVRELLVSRPERRRQQLWVRVNPPSSGLMEADLDAVFPGAPDGLVLPKVSAPQELTAVAQRLSAMESRADRAQACTRIIVIATETPQALLALNSYPGALDSAPRVRERLAGLTWGSEDLSAAMGVTAKTDASGALTFTFQLARSLCAITAAAAGVQAIDGIHADFRDQPGLRLAAEQARRDGFTGKLAIHPDQIEAINQAFQPSAAEVHWAKQVVAAFADGRAGVLSLDGKMIDRPHLLQARRILEQAARAET